MKISFGVLRFLLVLSLPGAYQAQATTYTQQFGFGSTGWKYEAYNTASAIKVNDNGVPAALLSVNWLSKENWSAVGRQHQFPARTVSGLSVSSANISSWDDYAVNMEVIDPATWRYIAVATHEVRGTGQVDTIPFPAFRVPSKPVYYRVSNLGAAWGWKDDWAGIFIYNMNFRAEY